MDSQKFNLKRIATLHDISGFGKCSLTIAIPVLAAMGFEVLPVPTAVLSTNTEFSDFNFIDLTDSLDDFINSWQDNKVTFDAMYSGFFGSSDQINIANRLINEFDCSLSVVDPVIGDNGKLFKTINVEMCNELKKLVKSANVITPNVTEACILTGQNFCSNELNWNKSKELIKALEQLGCNNFVITGITDKDKLVLRGMENGKMFEVETKLLDYFFSGTGDLFASVLTGYLLRGNTLLKSIGMASDFVISSMEFSNKIGCSHAHGVAFEPLLKKLMI